jgi:hypothetical protein
MLIALPVVVLTAVSLIVGMRIAGHGDATLRLTSRGSGTPAPAAQRTSQRDVPTPAPSSASPGGTPTPGGAPSPSALPSPIATVTATAIVTTVP